MSWKRPLVCGGAGFIGSHLVDALLDEGAEKVVVVDDFFLGRESNLTGAISTGRVEIYRESAGDYGGMRAICEAEHPDVVFNLATRALLYSFFNPATACRINLDIAETLGELQRHGLFESLVQISSSEVYGSGITMPMDEDHPYLAETSYAAGKAAADLLLLSYVKMFDQDVRIIRPFNNYGPRQNDGHLAAVIPLTIRRITNGEAPRLAGDGSQTRDFIYVADTVTALLALARHADSKGRVLNVGSGIETSIREIIETLVDLMGWTGGIETDPARPADVQRHLADVSAAEALIGPIATTPLRTGLAQTIEDALR